MQLCKYVSVICLSFFSTISYAFISEGELQLSPGYEGFSVNVCDVTPHVVQSWRGDSSLKWTSNTPNIQIKGTYQHSGQVGISIEPTNPTEALKTQCDGKECVENPLLYIQEPNIVNLDLPNGNNIDAGWQEIELANGRYNRVSSGGSGTIKLTGDTYYIESLVIGGSSKVVLSNNTKLYVNSLELSGSGKIVNNNHSLHIWAENYLNKNALVKVSGNLKALIFSRDKIIVFGGNGRINGRVTAKNIEIQPDGKIIDDGQSCPIQPSSHQLSLTPNKDFSLLCENPEVTVTVTDTQGNPATEQVEVHVTIPAGMTVDSVVEGSQNSNFSYSTNSSGVLTLRLDSTLVGTYKVEAELASDSSQNDSGDFLVSPYKLEASDVYAVAGQTATFDLKVLACKDNEATLVSGYQGDKNLNVSDFSLVAPTSVQGAVDGNLLVKSKSDWSDTSVIFEFDSFAQTTGSVIYSEVGKVSFKLSDSTFECPTGYDCQDNDGESWESLEGIVEVYVRPWQFAICTDSNSNGNSSGGSAFVAAGEDFDVFAKPIRFTSDTNQLCNNSLVTRNYLLSSGAVSANHTLDTPRNRGAVLGSLEPTSQLIQFTSDIALADNGYKFKNLKYSEAGSFNFEVTEYWNSFYGKILGGFSGRKSIGRFYPKYFLQGDPDWNVAGQNNIAYLGQPYDSAVHQVYPMASGESIIGNALNNYRFFSPSLQTKFGVLDDSSVDNGFLLDTEAGSWSKDRRHWLLDDRAAVLQRVKGSNGVTRKDNPFNTGDTSSTSTGFGLVFKESIDPVSFTDDGPATESALFPVQPPARYGRMALEDIGGNSNTTLTIPLKVEFWSGNEFILNTDDSYNINKTSSLQRQSSTFNSQNYCNQTIWNSDNKATTSILLDRKGNVLKGEGKITANQNSRVVKDILREQVRVWLRMGESTPLAKLGENPIICFGNDQEQPWLRYNWRQLGDEDPSAIITFGIPRGNDRVIYRGEHGMFGRK